MKLAVLCSVLLSSLLQGFGVAAEKMEIAPSANSIITQNSGDAYMSTWFRNIVLVLIGIQLVPAVIKMSKQGFEALAHPKAKVAIVPVKGAIEDSTAFVRTVKEFCEDATIKAIVLDIDSPGGAAGASQAMWGALRDLKAKHEKPVIAWVQNVAASGGYYVACAADHIVATPSAFIGSVGAYVQLWRVNELLDKYDIHYNAVSSGKFKTTGNMFLPAPGAESKAMLTALVRDTHDQFARDVRLSRGAKLVDDQWAEAGIFTGEQALKLGLIDEVGSQIEVELAVKRLADITTDIEWVRSARPSALARLLSGGADGDDDGSSPYISSCVSAVWNGIKAKAHQEECSIRL